jgi:Ca2+-binding RTX toxin-like protein
LATFNGTEGNDTLTGTAGADTINGRAGNDTIQGLAASDLIDAGAGDDTVDGGQGDDTIAGGGGNDSVLGGAGNDLVWVSGISGSDSGLSTGVYDGGDGDDYIRANGDLFGTGVGLPDVTILGGLGNDTIESGFGPRGPGFKGNARLIDAGDGDDTVNAAISDLFDGSIAGGSGFDVFNFTMQLSDPSVHQFNSLAGLTGFEVFDLTRTFTWDMTIKLVDANVGPGGLTVILSDGTTGAATRTPTIDASGVVSGGLAFRNQGIAKDDSVEDHITAGQGSDDIRVGGGEDYVDGQAGNDFILAGNGRDSVTGGTGNDTIDGGDDVDTAFYSGNFADYEMVEILYNTFTIRDLRGIDGTDTIIDVNKLSFADGVRDVVIQGVEIIGDDSAEEFTGGGFADHLDGAGGNDTLSGAGGHDKLEGGAGADTINGGDGNDSVEGDDGNDTLTGAAGNDTLTGGTGDDTYVLGDDTDTIVEGAAAAAKGAAASGGDTIVSSISRSLVDFANVENLKLTGAARDGTGNGGANLLTGSGVANLLTGGAGKDTLKGGGGGDSLVGGAGKDVLEGAAGKDKFVFLGLGDLGKKENKRDVIDDFKHSQKDKIDLSALDANSKSAKADAFKLLAAEGAKFTKHAGQLRWDEQGSGKDKITVIEGDVNGDGKADFQIELTGWVHLVKGDFVL